MEDDERRALSSEMFSELRQLLQKIREVETIAALEVSALTTEEPAGFVGALYAQQEHMRQLAYLYAAAARVSQRQYELWSDGLGR